MRLVMNEPVERMDRPYARRWWALLVLCLSLLIIVMANTALTVAAPDMTQDLGLSSADLQWVIDGYTVPYAALMLLLGAIGDKYSRRGALVLGLLVFGGGAVAGSLVDSADGVIAARAVMGFGAAMIMPATLSLLAATFPRAERAKAITLWTATAGLAIAAGPLLAGALLEQHSWKATFLINVPIAAAAIVGALLLVPPSKAHGKGRIDYVGGLLSVVWIAALVYMIIEGPHFGWGVKAVTAAVVAGVGLVLFVVWELRHPRPVIDVRRFTERRFAGSNLAVALFFLAVFGAFYYLTQQLQFVLGYTALETGLRMLPLMRRGLRRLGPHRLPHPARRHEAHGHRGHGRRHGGPRPAHAGRREFVVRRFRPVSAHPRPRDRARPLPQHGRDHGRVPGVGTGRRRRGERHLAGARRLARHRHPRFAAGHVVPRPPHGRDE